MYRWQEKASQKDAALSAGWREERVAGLVHWHKMSCHQRFRKLSKVLL